MSISLVQTPPAAEMELVTSSKKLIAPGEDDDDRDPTVCNKKANGQFICEKKIDSHRDCMGASDGLCPACRAKETCWESFLQKATSEDTTQLIAVLLSFLMQLYQMSVGSLIIIFTPQKCGDHACTFSENFEVDFPFYLVVLITNFVTFAFFLTMYILELIREDVLIATMDVDENVNNDGDDVAKRMDLFSAHEKKHLKDLCKWYKWIYYCSDLLFIMNAAFSLIIVRRYTIGSQTDTVFTTNVLFMVKKLIDVYSTVSAEENVFYSAYLLQKVQFNNVDSTIMLRKREFTASGKEYIVEAPSASQKNAKRQQLQQKNRSRKSASKLLDQKSEAENIA